MSEDKYSTKVRHTQIIVNGEKHSVGGVPVLGYSWLCTIAGYDPTKVNTVTYAYDGVNGSLTQGQCVGAKDGMIFNVTRTGGA